MQTQGVGAVTHQVHDKIAGAEEKKDNNAAAEAYWTHSSIREIHAENYNAIGIGGGLRSLED